MYRACKYVHLKTKPKRADKTKHYPRYIRVPLGGGRGWGLDMGSFFKININTRNVPSKISVNYWIFLASYLVHANMEINFMQIKTVL